MYDTVRQWTLLLVLTAFLLSVLVLGQIVSRYASAYLAAPAEVSAFLDALDSSVEENESYDHNLARVPRLEDKLRLGRLLRDIQKAGDDLREDLGALLDAPDSTAAADAAAKPFGGGGSSSGVAVAAGDVAREAARDAARDAGDRSNHHQKTGGLRARSTSGPDPTPTPRLRSPARLLWAARRDQLSERVRRLDLLRMRFLVIYMSIVAATTTAAAERVEKSAVVAAASSTPSTASSPRDPEKAAVPPPPPGPPPPPPPLPQFHHLKHVSHSFPALGLDVPAAGDGDDDSPRLRTPRRPIRRLTVQAVGYDDDTAEEDVPLIMSPGGTIKNAGDHRRGWLGVVEELQRSPLMQKRHASIESAMARNARSMTP